MTRLAGIWYDSCAVLYGDLSRPCTFPVVVQSYLESGSFTPFTELLRWAGPQRD